MYLHYEMTELEGWIDAVYHLNNIHHVADHSIIQIAEIFSVDVIFYLGPSFADWNENSSFIFIDSRLSAERQRAVFFHELCHPLRHVGYQGKGLPELMIELQEFQANTFQLYAALPMRLLEQYRGTDPSVISRVIALEFCLPIELVMKRTEQIHNRLYSNFNRWSLLS